MRNVLSFATSFAIIFLCGASRLLALVKYDRLNFHAPESVTTAIQSSYAVELPKELATIAQYCSDVARGHVLT
jgi:hypothetical protein